MKSFCVMGALGLSMMVPATGFSGHERGRVQCDADCSHHRSAVHVRQSAYGYDCVSTDAYRPPFVRPYSYAHPTYGYPWTVAAVGYYQPQYCPNLPLEGRTTTVVNRRHAVGTDELGLDVQRNLRRLGYYRGAIDGNVGPGTRAAIRNYQSEHGLRVTGRIDSELLEALEIG